jgi:hypothetical protein
MIIKIHNAETGEIIERDMTQEELDQAQKDKAKYDQEVAKQLDAENRKIALLEKLGITEDEADLLLTPNKPKIVENGD